MKKIVGLASSLVVALYSMNASAARELYVWEDEFFNRVEKEREQEIKSMKKIQNIVIIILQNYMV